MPYFICQNEECERRFFEKSSLAYMGTCPECGGDEIELEDADWEPAVRTDDRDRRRTPDAAAAAQRLLKRHGVTGPSIDVERIAVAEGMKVERRSLGDAEGFVQDGVLVVNSDQAVVRQRFTIAHELGHLELHPDGTDENSEREADRFANHLLIPRPTLREAFTRTPDVEALRQAFNVSKEALWIALTDAGLDKKLGA